ncbi:hypothetical protein GP475_01915 [Corynebacterium poyangense]|uniref:Uncharacterized protein n=1 Tax=Corynebacterium poyangense TaxID=2684405 RepID=A0A7H0SLV1_9CORY|nr:hypothetical protein [Corynebacterium poyangense]MBZ8177633.1 hypothetical protein [Corynebacterium poyangense]QNQ89526.1 hypothetical protein GP475_01915 [Corynebacterium poyangense]
MANLHITEHACTVELNWWEKLAARRSDLTIPVRVVRNVELLPDVSDVVAELRRSPGIRVSGLTSIGTFWAEDGSRKKTFAVCHGRRGGLLLALEGATFDQIVLSTDSARHYSAQLAQYMVDN